MDDTQKHFDLLERDFDEQGRPRWWEFIVAYNEEYGLVKAAFDRPMSQIDRIKAYAELAAEGYVFDGRD